MLICFCCACEDAEASRHKRQLPFVISNSIIGVVLRPALKGSQRKGNMCS